MAETGHIKNVENLGKARDFATSWGAAYQPSNPNLAIVAMTALIASAEGGIDGVQTQKTPYRNATAACEDAFEPLSKLTTRVMKSLKASGVPESVSDDAETYSRKIQGRRKTEAKEDDPSTPDVDESDASHSASQMSRSQRIENLQNLRMLLEAQALYAPNEVDLQTNTIKDLENDLTAKTQAVGTTFVAFSNSMADRDDVLYLNDENVVATGRLFKTYVEAAFSRNSTEWNQVKDLEFRDLRRI